MVDLNPVIQAFRSRQELWNQLRHDDTQCFRLFRGQVDGIEGWIVDRLGDLLWIQWREGECRLNWDQAKLLAEQCHEYFQKAFGIRATYLKRYVSDRSRLANFQKEGVVFEHTLGVSQTEWTATENGLTFRILPSESFSPGIFLDQRENRNWLRSVANGRRVLNLFAYTGAFSVCAAAGGASEVVTVDVSKKWLEVAKQNFALNQLAEDRHRCYATGARTFLQTGVKKGERFDLVILDPPSFSRSEKDGVFSLREERTVLWELGKQILAEDGTLFFSCNWQKLDQSQLRQECLSVFPAHQWASVVLPPAPADFLDTENPIAAIAFSKRSSSRH